MAEDDAADPKQGTAVAQKLADAKVVGVIGHLNSGTTIPASKFTATLAFPKFPLQPPTPSTPAKASNRVSCGGRRRALGSTLGKYALSLVQRASPLPSLTTVPLTARALPKSSPKLLRLRAVKVVAKEFTTDKATDFSSILTTIKARSPMWCFSAVWMPLQAPCSSK
jgi:branched-chain amino acid transport system substrate-binding protein